MKYLILLPVYDILLFCDLLTSGLHNIFNVIEEKIMLLLFGM